MTRGNQRDMDRAKAQKLAAAANKGKRTDGLTPQQARERDAAATLAKRNAKEAEKQKLAEAEAAAQRKKEADALLAQERARIAAEAEENRLKQASSTQTE